MLEAIGVGPEEERVYVELLRRTTLDLETLRHQVDLPADALRRALVSLVEQGLVLAPDGVHGQIRAANPGVALERLALQRLDALHQAQLAIANLAERFARRFGDQAPGDVVELVRGADAQRERYRQLQRASRTEISSLNKAPVVLVTPEANLAERDALAAGVRYRVVYDRALFDPDSPTTGLMLEDLARMGEQMRVAANVPFKMTVFDRRTAQILWLGPDGDEVVMLVLRAQPLVDACAWIFDRLWDTGVPVAAAAALVHDSVMGEEGRELLALLLAGYTDHAIATQLGLSMRTVQRRVQRLLTRAGVQTRIQLGWHAAAKGWI